MLRLCWMCGTYLRGDPRADAHYCSNACKQRAYRVRRDIRRRIKAGEPHDRAFRYLLRHPEHPEWERLFGGLRE